MTNDEIRMKKDSHWSSFLLMRQFQASQFARFMKFALVWALNTIALWTAWFYLWFNHGWFGSTGIIVRWKNADGEGAYNAMDTEMLLISASVCLAITVYFYRASKNKEKCLAHSLH